MDDIYKFYKKILFYLVDLSFAVENYILQYKSEDQTINMTLDLSQENMNSKQKSKTSRHEPSDNISLKAKKNYAARSESRSDAHVAPVPLALELLVSPPFCDAATTLSVAGVDAAGAAGRRSNEVTLWPTCVETTTQDTTMQETTNAMLTTDTSNTSRPSDSSTPLPSTSTPVTTPGIAKGKLNTAPMFTIVHYPSSIPLTA